MTGVVGQVFSFIPSGGPNSHLSTDLNSYVHNATGYGDGYFHSGTLQGSHTYRHVAPAARYGVIGQVFNGFRQDYYDRIHVIPSKIELGTLAGSTSREIVIWNAYTEQSPTLNSMSVTINQGVNYSGITFPLVFTPLMEKTVTMNILSNGPATILAQVSFDFNVGDPLPIFITGVRSVILPLLPEVPVRETWEWLTDIYISADGTEQRVGLRGSPRRALQFSTISGTVEETREQLRILMNARGRMFIPYYQWATRVLAEAGIGATSLSFNTARCDVQSGEYVIINQDNVSKMVQLDIVGTNTATLMAPLDFVVKLGATVAPAFSSVVENNATVRRQATDNSAEMTLTTQALTHRAIFQRPGNTATLVMLDSLPVLTRQQIGEDDTYSLQTGQEVLDAKTGLKTLENDWDFTKTNRSLEFLVHRMSTTGPAEMDYWRLFFDTIRGSLGAFLVPTFRSDQSLSGVLSDAAASFALEGESYVTDFYPMPGYRYLAIETDGGTHYCKVTAASTTAGDNSSITISPALPAGAPWTVVRKISYLIKSRMGGDKVSLDHYALDTYIGFPVRSVK